MWCTIRHTKRMTKILLVGLMNPGDKYRNTRHNAGAMALDVLYPQAIYRRAAALESGIAELEAEHSLILQKPETFMNLSGNAVSAALKKYSIPPARLIVLHDEVELAPGVIRHKFGGGHKGHNGLRSIIERIATADFHRIRIGVGRPTDDRGGIADFLLSVQPVTERAKAEALQVVLQPVLTSFNNA